MKKLFSWSNKIEVAKESIFKCAGNILRTRIFIKGVNNHLDIANNTKILNYDIVLKGSGNSLKFEHDCSANGNHVSLTMWEEGDEEKYD
ncbi:MAG: hypothetical protein QNJ36_02795 [Calothrix sp. MO_167.B42]|nr:hypothetical protein [Calothrix sp. MO_167.B42]